MLQKTAPSNLGSQVLDRTTQYSPLVLVVESKSRPLAVLREKLEKEWNVVVHEANCYASAKEKLKKLRNDYLVVICDLSSPHLKGEEILDLVDKAGVRSIALTGAYTSKTRNKLSKNLLVDYVLKKAPNSYEYIINLVGRLYKNQFIKVLLVDDSKSALAMLADMLSLLNFRVFTAQNGEEAISIINAEQGIRLILTDYEMPKMDGFEFTVKARKLFDKDHLAIIGLSASGKSDLGARFIKNGANDFILKPYSFEELMCRINMNIDALEHLDFINELANKDSLTKLFNRRYFFSVGNQMLSHALLEKTALTAVMFDIDFFKRINDQYGHDGGDAALMHFTKLFNEKFSSHLSARIGGEEFAVLLSYIGNQEAKTKLEEFRKELASKKLIWGNEEIIITVSIGAFTGLAENLDEMLKIADMNLYHAKENGRNRLQITSSNTL